MTVIDLTKEIKTVEGLIAKSNSAEPMGFNKLLELTGYTPELMTNVLDWMHDYNRICEANIIRDEVAERVVWPTIIATAGAVKFSNPHRTGKPQPPTLPSRVGSNPMPTHPKPEPPPNPPKVTTTPPEKEPIMDEAPAELQNKSTAYLMLKYISEHPDCTGAELREAAKVKTVDAYIPSYLVSGMVVKRKVSYHEARYTLAEGQTLETIYRAGRRGPRPKKPAENISATQFAKPSEASLPEANPEISHAQLDFRERLTANAIDFDGIVSDILKFVEAFNAPLPISPVTFKELREANIARDIEWGNGQQFGLSYRGNELAGETGEACNVLKKLDRERRGLVGSRATIEQLAEELADVVICADLAAMDLGIDLAAAIARKFNATSDKNGLLTHLPEAANEPSAA